MRIESRNGRVTLTLRPAPPLDVELTLQRYRLWGPDPATVYHQGALYRVAQAAHGRVPFRLTASGTPDRPCVTLAFDGTDAPDTRAVVRTEARRLIGADVDLSGFHAMAARDPVLGPLVGRESGLWGLRPTLSPDPFEMLVGAISAQQVNLAFAFTTRARLVRRFGEPVVLDGVTVYAFPSAATLAAAAVATLRRMQFSERKAEYIIGLAGQIVSGRLDLPALATLPDDEVIARLTRVRGLGRWTAEWFLARGLGRPDVCPAADLAVRRAVEAFCFRGRPSDPTRVRRRALAWRPYRSLAVHYLLDGLRLARTAADAAPRARAAGEA